MRSAYDTREAPDTLLCAEVPRRLLSRPPFVAGGGMSLASEPGADSDKSSVEMLSRLRRIMAKGLIERGRRMEDLRTAPPAGFADEARGAASVGSRARPRRVGEGSRGPLLLGDRPESFPIHLWCTRAV